MVQNQDLCLWCCDWIGAGSLASLPLPLSLTHSLQLRWASEWALRPLISTPPSPHWLICLSNPHPPTPTGEARLQAGRGSVSPSDKATRPRLTFHPSLSPGLSPPTCAWLFAHSPHSLFLCFGTEGRGQAGRQAGGLVCGTVLISTGIWRRKSRYLQSPSSKPLPLRLLRLLPSCRLRRQVCEGCRCQLSFSWTAANLFSYLPSVVILSLIRISLSLFTHLPQFIC